MKKSKDLYKADSIKLTQSFQEACADKEFKDFVYGLNVKEEILERYTSSLHNKFLL